MKKLLAQYKKAVAAANKADAAWEANPENEALEAAFDKAYQAEYRAFEALADGIVKISAGQIDKKTAELIIRAKGEQLEALIARMA